MTTPDYRLECLKLVVQLDASLTPDKVLWVAEKFLTFVLEGEIGDSSDMQAFFERRAAQMCSTPRAMGGASNV